jgi:thiol-disulfide isomerase/thioredoxin
LIDCWASWSPRSTAKMPGLKALYERRRGDGLEVIGVNLDQSSARGERFVKALALQWRQVYVPDDSRTRRLWSDGPGYPHMFLIDRRGILRWESTGSEELEGRINTLLDAPAPLK